MSEVPSYSTPGLSAARPRLSASSLTSMILGILFCIPLVTSLSAIICAIVGFRATRGSAMRGRGFAVAGLVLGIIGVLIWSGIGCLVAFIIMMSSPARTVLHDFASNVVSGNSAAAAAEADSTITQAQLDALHDYVVPFGTYADLTCTSANIRSTSVGESCDLAGQMHFASGTHFFTAVLIKNAAGTWKVHGIHVY